MGKEFKAPYSAVQAGKEDINTMNGALNLSVTDISLPGINNFDLNLTRVYNNQDTEQKYTMDFHSSHSSICSTDVYKYKDYSTGTIYYVLFESEEQMINEANNNIYTSNFSLEHSSGSAQLSSSNPITVYSYNEMQKMTEQNAQVTLSRIKDDSDSVLNVKIPSGGHIINALDNFDKGNLNLGLGWQIKMPHMIDTQVTPISRVCSSCYGSYCESCWSNNAHTCSDGSCPECSFCRNSPDIANDRYETAFRDWGGNIIAVTTDVEYMGDELREAETYDYQGYTLQYANLNNTYENKYDAQMDISYCLKATDSEGKSYYFNSSGNLVAYADRFGNFIKYEYGIMLVGGYSQWRLNKITDTLGRQVLISWDSNGEYVNSITVKGQEADSQSRTVTYTRETVWGDDNTISADDIYRLTVTDFSGKSITYEGTKNQIRYLNGNNRKYTYGYNINKIYHPTGLETKFTYDYKVIDYSFPKNGLGTVSRFEVKNRVDIDGNTELNRKQFTYNKSAESYLLSNSIPDYSTAIGIGDSSTYMISSTYYEQNDATDAWEASQRTSFRYAKYFSYSRMEKESRLNELYGDNSVDSETVFNSNMQVEKNINDGITTTYEYDNNPTHHTDPGFGLMKKSTTVYKNGDSVIREYTLTDPENPLHDRKVVKGEKVYHRKNGVTTLTEEKAYAYNTYGERISERTKMGDSDWIETQTNYQYHPNVSTLQTPTETATGLQDMLLKTTTVKNVENITNTQGSVQSQPQDIETKEVLDFFGNVGLSVAADGGTTKYTRDALGRVTQQVYPDNTQTTTVYQVNTSQNRIISTDQNGQERIVDYDRLGQYIGTYVPVYTPATRADNYYEMPLEEVEYDSVGRIIARTVNVNENGSKRQVTLYEYNNSQNMVSKEEVRENSKTGTLLRKNTYFRNRALDPEDYDRADKYEKDTMKTQIGIYDNTRPGDGMVYQYVYEHMKGYTTKETVEVTVNGTKTVYGNTYDYNDDGRLVSMRDFKSNRNDYITAQYGYDAAGRQISETNGIGQTKTTSYDSAGRVASETGFDGKTTTYTYNDHGQVIKTTKPFESGSMSETRQYYDVRGNVTLEEIKTEEGEYRRTYYGYDTMNRLKYTAYDGSSGKTYVQYGYDNIGNMTEMVTGLSGLMADINGELPEGAARTKYEYDQYGHMSKMILPDGSEREYESDLTGNIIKEVYPDGEISYTYSAAGELLSMTGTKGEESKTYQYQYDSLGRRKKAIHGEPENGYPNQTVYSYDEIGRLVKEEEQRGESRAISKEYIYDSASNVDTFILKEENTVLQNIRYNYDYLNRLVKVTDQKNGNYVAAEYSYDNAGRLSVEKQDNSQLETTYSYNAGGMVTGIVHKKGIEELASESYTYYADGMKKSENGKEYQYDGAGRLSIAGNPYGKYVYYDYDRRGNRVKETRMGEGTYSETNYEYNRNNELVKEEKITGVDPVSTTWYTYDARGNVLSSTVDEYSNAEAGAAEGITGAVLGESETSETAMYGYDVFGRMEQIVKGEQQIRYVYNADGQRTLKDADGTVSWYVWDGENIAAELEIGREAVYYQRGIGLIAAESENGSDYYLKNAHGDVTGVYSTQTNSLKKSYAYDPFGSIVNPENINEILPEDPNDTNPYRYAGEYYDRETGNYYLRARYYAPSYGRFMQIDPIRDGTNWYIYCDNDPVNRVDPSGLDAILITDNGSAYLQGHTSALFQDGAKNWYYYYWGDKEALVREVKNPSAMASLSNFNWWLHNQGIYQGDYDVATYVAGNFTASLSHAVYLAQNYTPSQYNVLTRNCMQTTWECFIKGWFWDHVSVNSVVSSRGIRPNSYDQKFIYTFYNSAFTYAAYWKTINDQLWEARQQPKSRINDEKIRMLEHLYF